MTTYRTGTSWHRHTIIREGVLPADEKGRRPDDLPVAWVDSAAPEGLAERICALLNASERPAHPGETWWWPTDCAQCDRPIGPWSPDHVGSAMTHIVSGGAPDWDANRDHTPVPERGTPDRTYLRGVSDALAEVRRRLDRGAPPAIIATLAVRRLLDETAAELGVDEEGPRGPLRSTQGDLQPSAQGSGATEAAETISGRFTVWGEETADGGRLWMSDHRHGCVWSPDIEQPADLAELNRRAGEHAEVCG